ncbi:DoxX family protein [Paenibacillus sp. MMS18-CY102]|uniref:DoxX family protein n=1 Tax=Paenibacillus sp. MMS18-CY102 TaxID=2682849 RepID=UPI001365CEED|nr:DoxX family membrane protein [Paenibacillus sp. MMS18-CY102]
MNVVSIIISALLGLMFLMAGIMKMSGVKMHVENFRKLGLPQWFRVFTGFYQVVSAVVIIVGIWADGNGWSLWGGLLLALTMLVAALVHVRAKDSAKETMPAVVLFILAAIVLLINL